MSNDFFQSKTVLMTASDELVADLPQHSLFLGLADLDLLVTDEGAGALLRV